MIDDKKLELKAEEAAKRLVAEIKAEASGEFEQIAISFAKDVFRAGYHAGHAAAGTRETPEVEG